MKSLSQLWAFDSYWERAVFFKVHHSPSITHIQKSYGQHELDFMGLKKDKKKASWSWIGRVGR